MPRHPFPSIFRSEPPNPSPRPFCDPAPARMLALLRLGIGCAAMALPFACAHGVELSLEPFGGDASSTNTASTTVTSSTGVAGIPVNVGTGTMTTVGGGHGGTTSGSAGLGGLDGSGGGAGGASAGLGGAGGSAAGAGGMSGSLGPGGMSGSLGLGGQDAGRDASDEEGGLAIDASGDGPSGNAPRPIAITLSQTAVSTGQQMSQTTTGVSFSQRCAQDQVLIGFTGTVEPPGSVTNWLRSFQSVCGSLSIAATTYAVTTTQTIPLPRRGVQQTVAQMSLCPANQVVVGFVAKSGGWIDQLTPTCAPLGIEGMSPSYALSIGTRTALPQYVGGPNGDVTVAFQCPAGQIAVGDEGRDSMAIEAFGLRCALPALVVQ